jgi:hypothetical protein
MEKRIKELVNERLREELEKDVKIDRLEARLPRYENPHIPPSK